MVWVQSRDWGHGEGTSHEACRSRHGLPKRLTELQPSGPGKTLGKGNLFALNDNDLGLDASLLPCTGELASGGGAG